jgi:predicted AAA+ superfamily ATPase
MSNKSASAYHRPQFDVLRERLRPSRGLMQVVAGPRQVGKTTLVLQVLESGGFAPRYASADEPGQKDVHWIATQWEAARRMAAAEGIPVLALDEIQKIQGWSETVKRLWDEDSREKRPLRVVLLGSSPLLVQKGLTESLAGRFEVLRLSHWSYAEMRASFGFGLDDFLYFGGYPGAAPLAGDPVRWRAYILDALIEPTLSRDVLLMNRVDKPALLRQVFELGCLYSGQTLSLTKLMGQLQDAGNTTTLSHYLDLLQGAGLLAGLRKYAGQVVRQRASSPKFQVLNTALLSALSGRSPAEALSDPVFKGHLVESAVGAHLFALAAEVRGELFHWREGALEVDFVFKSGTRISAFEVKSGPHGVKHGGLAAFEAAFAPWKSLMIGGDGFPLEEFLLGDVTV